MLAHELVVPRFLLYLLLHDDVHHLLTQVAHQGLDSSDRLVAVQDYGYVFRTVGFRDLFSLLVGTQGLLV